MKKFLLAGMVLFFSSSWLFGQDPAVAQATANLVSQVQALEGRVSTLEAMVHPQTKLTYFQAREKAIAENKPLVVWSGTAICPPCVTATQDEFVSYVGNVEGLPTDAITVGLPANGDCEKVQTITYWVTGDSVYGHVPSIRRALLSKKVNRAAVYTTSAPMMMGACANGQCGSSMIGMSMMGGMMGSGGCASGNCGSSTGRVGLFGRVR